MRRLSIITWACAGLLAACGGKTITGLSSTSSSGTSSSSGTTIVSMGSGSGSGFEAGVIAIGTASLSAGGSTSLTVTLVDQTGAPYTTSTAITFSSPCIGQRLASITVPGAATPGQTITTTTGTASVTYVASGCSGSDVITATAQPNSQNLTATGTITVQKATIGSISFISATPSNITLKGTGATTGGSSTATSTVIFKVLDTSGGPSPNAPVTFTPTTTVGGITITPTSGTTDANGQIQTIVTGGTVATTVRITATTTTSTGQSISTQSSALTISTGIPTSSNISLAVQCPNVEAYNTDGVTMPVTVRMTDRFSNPVPDGTTANFQTTLGGIQGTCQTSTTTSQSGFCTVNWVSKAPYVLNGNPQTTAGSKYLNTAANYCVGASGSPSQQYCNGTTNGRSPIYATAVGEESFVDANGNGIFDPGDTVAFDATNKDNDYANGTPKPWFDTSEPFLNEWELYDTYGTPTYVQGEPFIDFNDNGTRDGPDGLFNGTLCEGPLCAPAGKQSAAISDSNVIIVSTPQASYTIVSVVSSTAGQTNYPSGTSFTLPAGGTLTINMWIYDGHYQQMAQGTVVTASLVGTNPGTITTPLPYQAWPCSSAAPKFDANGNVLSAGQQFSFSLSAPTVSATNPQTNGVLYVTVQSTTLKTTIPITILAP